MDKKNTESSLKKELKDARKKIRQLELELKTSREENIQLPFGNVTLDFILQASPVAIGISRIEDGKILFANQKNADIIGGTLEEYIGSYSTDLWVSNDERNRYVETFRKLGRVPGEEIQLKRHDGSVIWALVTWEKIRYKDKDCILYWAYDVNRIKKAEDDLQNSYQRLEEIIYERTKELNHEINKRKGIEEELRKSEQKFRRIFENMQGGYLLADMGGDIILANPASARLLEYSMEELLKKNLTDHIYRNASDNIMLMEKLRSRKRLEKYEISFVKKTGETFIAEYNVQAIKDDDGNITAMEGVFYDITGRKRIEEELMESEEKYRLLVETMNDGVSVADANNIITYVNPSFCKMLDYSKNEILGRFINDFLDKDNRKISRIQEKKRKSGKNDPYEMIWLNKTGKKVITNISPQPIINEDGDYEGSFAVISDITAYKKTQEMIIQTEKMMTVGGLAAGMAHEINNPLGVILQGLQMTFNRLKPDVEMNINTAADIGTTVEIINEYLEKRRITEYLKGMEEAGKRAASIVTNMLHFSRKSTSEKYPADINTLIDNTLDIASKEYDLSKNFDFRNVNIIRKYSDELPMIRCSPTEIEQVMLNLLKNSVHAMYKYKTKCTDKNYIPEITIITGKDDSHVFIEISDNGPGVESESVKHIFEPFYTTKDVGEGTGLGLFVSYFIITNSHDGKIEAYSEPGKGLMFNIKLPL